MFLKKLKIELNIQYWKFKVMTVEKPNQQRRQKATTSDATIATKKNAIFPIFAECAEYTLDTYWISVFKDCSIGKFPRYAHLNPDNNTLTIKKGTAITSYKLTNKPDIDFKQIKTMFQNELHLKSDKDQSDMSSEIKELCKILDDSFNDNWQKIKLKKIKDPIIRRYILDLKERYQLDDLETIRLAHMIKIGFSFNWISSESIEYKNKRITNINTLHFDEDERRFELVEPNIEYKREYKKKKFILSSLWKKYIQNPKNKHIISSFIENLAV